ncbi:MAG: orotidine-5'-phosphate decarboxylase, partial [Actinomycetota bacterium]
GAIEFAEKLHADGKKIFLDLKLFDVPETVANAVRQLRQWATFTTVHGYEPLVRAAVAARQTETKLLAVTVLTSLDRADMQKAGLELEVAELVMMRAKAAAAAGADGVIASGREAGLLRAELGRDFLIVTPGIREGDGGDISGDDQKRTMTVAGAFQAGADYIVVGRPIKEAADPRRTAEAIQETIARIFP